jgi:hypothetical protein
MSAFSRTINNILIDLHLSQRCTFTLPGNRIKVITIYTDTFHQITPLVETEITFTYATSSYKRIIGEEFSIKFLEAYYPPGTPKNPIVLD